VCHLTGEMKNHINQRPDTTTTKSETFEDAKTTHAKIATIGATASQEQ
jgi:hypothetical protein